MEVEAMSRASKIALATALGVAAAVYWFVVRPSLRQWGATRGEADERLPGDDLVPEPADEITRAITIDAPAEEVWPQVVRLGQSHGGIVGAAVPGTTVGASSPSRSRPDQQTLEVGDTVPLIPESLPVDSSMATPEVAVLDDERALGLRSSPERPTVSWAFVLEPDEEGTKLIVRTRARQPGSTASRAGARLLAEPIHFAVERRLLVGLKQRAENAERGTQDTDAVEPELGPTV
jgi:hypothetical protein